MKDELKKYLKELNVTNNNDSGNIGSNGISTRVNNTQNYMPNINKVETLSTIDYGTPSTASSYSSAYSPY